jgi:hypothetical protein
VWKTAAENHFEAISGSTQGATGEQSFPSIFGSKNLRLKEFCHFPKKWQYRGSVKGGVNVWNIKGLPVCFHNMVFTFIKDFNEKEIESFVKGQRAEKVCAWCKEPRIVGRACLEEDGGEFTCFRCWTEYYGERSYPWTEQRYAEFLENGGDFSGAGGSCRKKAGKRSCRSAKPNDIHTKHLDV